MQSPAGILFRLLWPVLLVGSVAACETSSDAPSPAVAAVQPASYAAAPGAFQVFGYHAWWMRDLWQGYDLTLLDRLLFFELRATPDGGFEDRYGWPDDWQALLAAARDRGVAVAPTVAVLDPGTFRILFGDPVRRQALLASTLAVVREAEADGVHLNAEMFEAAPATVRDGFTAFVRDLRTALQTYRPDAELSVFVPGFDHGEAYDEAALAAMVDYLVVQGYDMHWLTSPDAGPVAPLTGWGGANWQAIVDRYVGLGVPRARIVMTVPYFGYEWPTVDERPGAATRGAGQPITYAPVDAAYLPFIRIAATERVAAYGLRRDPVSDTPYYAYREDDGWRQGWFEDPRSLAQKYAFVKQEGLGGVALFLLGYDGGAFDTVLREALEGF